MTAAVAAVAVIGLGRDARADGAFPDAETVLLPVQPASRIVLASNFGLVISEDDGAQWQYSCESRATSGGRLYALGPPPDERVFAVSDYGVALSADAGCTWRVGSGPFDGGLVFDVFPDGSDASRVLVVAKPPGLGTAMPVSVFESADGGTTFPRMIFAGPASGGITGVEIARSDPRTTYVSWFELDAGSAAVHPRLARSDDRGATWQVFDLEPALGVASVSIAAVDPLDARRIHLRVVAKDAAGASVERVAASADAGATFATPIALPGGRLTSLLARRNGTVLVAGVIGTEVVGFRSRDAGATYDSWEPGIHPRGFGERGTTLYAAADGVLDGFSLASSDDDGDSWTPRMRFADIRAIRACDQQECVDDCGQKAAIALFAPAVCEANASVGGDGPPPTSQGCGCEIGGRAGQGVTSLAMVALGLLLSRRRRRARWA